MRSVDPAAVQRLTKSIEQFVQLYPVIICAEDGDVLVGRHRQAAGAKKAYSMPIAPLAQKWGISLEVAKLVVRMHGNIQRNVTEEETRDDLVELANKLTAGMPNEHVAARIMELVPYSEQYVDRLLPEQFKDPVKVRAGRASAEVRQRSVNPVEQKHEIRHIFLTETQILKVYDDFESSQKLLCPKPVDGFVRGVQYALRHVEGGKWVDD